MSGGSDYSGLLSEGSGVIITVLVRRTQKELEGYEMMEAETEMICLKDARKGHDQGRQGTARR